MHNRSGLPSRFTVEKQAVEDQRYEFS